MANVFRKFPSVSELLESPPLKKLLEGAASSRNTVVHGVRDFLDSLRGEMSSMAESAPGVGDLAERIASWISRGETGGPQPVINATGILLHPVLGRAPLAAAASEAVAALTARYSDWGEEAGRHPWLSGVLQRLTGADSSLVLNHRSAAVLLALSSLGAGREVLISRGELIDSADCRLTELLAASGATLREVGAANQTRLEHYRAAACPASAAVLRVSSADYQPTGDCQRPELHDLCQWARQRHLPVIELHASGALLDPGPYGVQEESTVRDSVEAGVDLVVFGSEQLAGGPQAGVVVERRPLIQQLRQHPLAAPLQPNSLTLAALTATLRLWEQDDREEQLPLLRMLTTSPANLRNRAERLAPQLEALESVAEAVVWEGQSRLGMHPLPTRQIPSCGLSVAPSKGDVAALAKALRAQTPGVWGRERGDRLLLDLRTVTVAQDEQLVDVFRAV